MGHLIGDIVTSVDGCASVGIRDDLEVGKDAQGAALSMTKCSYIRFRKIILNI